MGNIFPKIPCSVPKIETAYRRIVTDLPVPESIPILEEIERYQPHSLQGQPPVVWDHAEGFQVHDPYGNKWLDWSSGVLVANAGHGHPAIKKAIQDTASQGLLFSYCFPTQEHARLAKRLVELAPDGLDKAFLLSTGSETTECAIKLCRTHGQRVGSSEKIIIVTFDLGFHGRTLGAQLAGGYPGAKTWAQPADPNFVQVPFPDGFRCQNTDFDLFEESLIDQGVNPDHVAGVMIETYQGGGASFAPKSYVQSLRRWCDKHKAVMVFDEVQAGFGRTGKLFGFEHYEVTPDLACFGKGISSSLPLSAILGRRDLMDQYGPGSMTSTHGGHPVCCAAAFANLEALIQEKIVENAATVGAIMRQELETLSKEFSTVIGALHGKGLVYGLHVVKPGTDEPDGDLAFDVARSCFEMGLLMFAPVGFGGATIKICPPLVITEEAVRDGVEVLRLAFQKALQS